MADTYTRLGVDDELRRSLCQRCGLSSVDFVSSIDSTQRRARELAVDESSDWTLVVADFQTAGRGQHGRRWSASPGTSVMFSLVVHPRCAEAMAQMPIRTGLAAAEALEELLGPAETIGLKWPNDLMARDAKLGGILCEGQIRGAEVRAIVGVGINVRPFDPLLGPLTSPAFVDALAGRPVDRFELLAAVVACIRHRIDVDAAQLTDDELAQWRSRDWLAGREINAPIAGHVDGIDASGHLRVRTAEGTLETVVAGSVELA